MVLADRQREQRPVGQRHAHGLGLRGAGGKTVEEASVDTGRLESLVAEGARAVGEREGHHDQVAALDCAHIGADVLDDPDRLVAHRPAGLGGLQVGVRPQVAAADAGARDADDRVGRLEDGGIREVLDADAVTSC